MATLLQYTTVHWTHKYTLLYEYHFNIICCIRSVNNIFRNAITIHKYDYQFKSAYIRNLFSFYTCMCVQRVVHIIMCWLKLWGHGFIGISIFIMNNICWRIMPFFIHIFTKCICMFEENEKKKIFFIIAFDRWHTDHRLLTLSCLDNWIRVIIK